MSANVILDNATKKVDNFTLSYLYDPSQLLSVEQISQTKFTKTLPSQFSFGYIDGTTWYKITVENQSDTEEFILSFLEPFSDALNLYREQDGSFIESKNGLSVPLDKREVYDSNPTFNLYIKKGQTKTYYIEAYSKFSSAGEFAIYDKDTYTAKAKPFFIAKYMFYFGSLFIVFLFNLFLFVTVKDRIYAYYTAYTLTYALFVLVLSGFDLYFGFESWHERFHIVTPLVMVFLVLFSSYFLQTRVFYPKLFKLLMANVLVYAMLVPLVFITVDPWIEVANAITTFTFILLIIIAIMTIKKGFTLAKYYLFIMLIYISSLALMSSVLMGDIPNTHFNRYIFIVASYLEIISFSLILAKIYSQTNSARQRDPLTGLYSRRYFSNIADENLKLSKQDKQAFSILMIGIDLFREINETYGHKAGDEILIQLSKKLVELSRIQDIVSKHGGEEFIMLLPDTNTPEAIRIANSIRQEIQDMNFKLNSGETFSITISIGVSQATFDDNLSIEKIILDADINLYQAKENGVNKVYSV